MSLTLKRSVLRRLFLWFVVLAGGVSAVLYYFYFQFENSVPYEVYAGSIGGLLLVFLFLYYKEIVRPLRKILFEMKALLTGRKYRKIYTKRMDEIGIIAHFFNEVTKNFEKVSMDIKEGKRMMNELEIAGQIQRDILPLESPDVPGLDVCAKTRPAEELGGDTFDFLTVGDNTFMYIGDVTGHGVPAALVMVMVNTLVHTYTSIYDSGYDVIVNVNKQLKDRIKSTMFMTTLLLRWHHPSQQMYFVGSGHEHLMVYRAAAGKCETRQSGGIALGMVPDNSALVKEIEMSLEVGDVIILYSDGLTEGRNLAGEQYTMERLIEAVERFASQYGPDGIVNHVAKDYSQFVQDHVQDDDVTLIAVKYVGLGNEGKGIEKSTSWTDMLMQGKQDDKKEEK